MNHDLKTNLYERKHFLENTIAEKEHALQTAPEGELRFNHHGRRIQYYCRTDPKDTNGKYIKAKDQDFASALAQKDYDRKVLKLAQSELRSIDPLLNQYETGLIESVYENLPEPRQKLVCPVILTDEKYIEKWQAVPYEKKEFSDNTTEYYTAKEERVRSKSEILIADALNRMGIPYHYEYPLKLKRFGTIYPDFTVLNVNLRKTFLWEHFGMMDDPEYAEKAIAKLNTYEKNGYFPGNNLILTFETSSRPIPTKLIEKLISHYLV